MRLTQLKVLNSSILLVLANLLQRLIGLISVVILARILDPSDFAVVAIISIVIYFFDILSQAGSQQYIAQKSKVGKSDLNTAWTIDVLLKAAIYAIIFFAAPLFDDFYADYDLTLILRVSACILLLNALANPYLHLLKKQMRYERIFQLTIVQKLFAFAFTIAIAIITESYWAFIVGDLVAATVMMLGSYLIAAYIPKFTIRRITEQWRFSRWMMLKSAIGYVRSQADSLIVSKSFNANIFGNYYVARDIVMLPANNILMPALQPLIAAFKNHTEQPSLLKQKFELAFALLTFSSAPILVFIIFFPKLIVLTLLGEKWHAAIELLPYLALLMFYIPYIVLCENLLIAWGKVKVTFNYDLISCLIVIAVLILSLPMGLEWLISMRGLTGFALTAWLCFYIYRLLPFSMSELFSSLFASAGIALICAWLSQQFAALITHWHIWLQAIAVGAIFVLMYAAVTFSYLLLSARYLHLNIALLNFILEAFHSFKRVKEA